MNLWHDLHPRKHSQPLRIGRELFDSTHDVLHWVHKEEKKIAKHHHWFKKVRTLLHFGLLTSILFVVLVTISNWSAYSAFARAVLLPESLNTTQSEVQSGIDNTLLETGTATTGDMNRQQKILQRQLTKSNIASPTIGVDYFDQDVSDISLSLDITPYEDRIVIPKIGKNIPLVNVEQHDADNSEQWHEIFMRELENGIIKYPGSADPGDEGNSFIFGHSSNYPWAKGDYNDVFALLNELVAGDEIIVYFQQKKYIYTVRDKTVVKPGHVSSLGDTPNKKQLTLMTCWPLGTTLNRLLVITELTSTSGV